MPTPILFIPGFMQRARAPGRRWPSSSRRRPTPPARPPRALLRGPPGGDRRGGGGCAAGRLLARRPAGAARGAARPGALRAAWSPSAPPPASRSRAARAARAEADDRLASWIEAAPIEDIVAVWERQPLFADQSETLVEAQRAGRLAQDPRELALPAAHAPGRACSSRSGTSCSTLELPVLAIAGGRDEGYASAAAQDRGDRAERAGSDRRGRGPRRPPPAARTRSPR